MTELFYGTLIWPYDGWFTWYMSSSNIDSKDIWIVMAYNDTPYAEIKTSPNNSRAGAHLKVIRYFDQ